MTLEKLAYLANDILSDLNKSIGKTPEEQDYINGQKSMLEWMLGQIKKG